MVERKRRPASLSEIFMPVVTMKLVPGFAAVEYLIWNKEDGLKLVLGVADNKLKRLGRGGNRWLFPYHCTP